MPLNSIQILLEVEPFDLGWFFAPLLLIAFAFSKCNICGCVFSEANEKESDKVSDQLQSVGISDGGGAGSTASGKLS